MQALAWTSTKFSRMAGPDWRILYQALPANSATFLAGETKAVGADDRAVLQRDIVAELAVLADDGMSMGKEPVSDGRVRIDHDVRQDDGVVADRDLSTDDGVSAYVRVGSDGCGWVYGSSRMNTGQVRGRLVEEFDEPGERQIGVGDTERSGRDLGEVGLDQYGCCAGGAGERGVLRIGNEGDVPGLGLFDSGDAGDGLPGVAAKLCAKMPGDVSKR